MLSLQLEKKKSYIFSANVYVVTNKKYEERFLLKPQTLKNCFTGIQQEKLNEDLF